MTFKILFKSEISVPFIHIPLSPSFLTKDSNNFLEEKETIPESGFPLPQ